MLRWSALFFFIAAAGTWLARRYALHRELLDHPGERRSHQVATPRGGGVAIVAALLVATVALAIRDPSQRLLLGGFGIGLVLVSGIGLIDDHRPLSARLRLGVHVAAGLVWAITAYLVSGNPWMGVLAFVLVPVLTNIWNFMDGINGLAASQALLVGVGLAWLLGSTWGLLAWALMSGSAGFLPFNYPMARIFLGDVGSGAIGFAIAALVTVAAMFHGSAAVWLLLPLSAFVLDAGLTLLMRLLQGERWWTAHTRHAYQAWARAVGHTRVTLAYAGWTTLSLALMFLLGTGSLTRAIIACVATYLAGMLVWWTLQETQLRVPSEKQDDR